MNLGLLLLRLTVGLTIAAHAPAKLSSRFGYGPDKTGQMMETLGFRPGRRHALLAGAAELVGGVLLAIGMLTPLGAALVASVMLVAALTVHARNGFFGTAGGYEYNLVLGMAALAVAFTGAGTLSIDGLLHDSLGGTAWGIGAAVVAVLGAIGELAQRQASVPHTAAA